MQEYRVRKNTECARLRGMQFRHDRSVHAALHVDITNLMSTSISRLNIETETGAICWKS